MKIYNIENKYNDLNIPFANNLPEDGYSDGTIPILNKTCKGCKETLSVDNFGKSKNNSDGRENICKKCRTSQRKNNATKGLFSNKKFKTCSKCKKELDIFNFSKDSSRDDGFSAICKPCKNISYMEYSGKLESKILARTRTAKWKDNNPEKIKNYYLNNKDKIIKKTSEYHKEYKGKYTLFISQAKYRNISCSISLDEYNNIISKNCHYCNSLENIGIDRLNSDLGYDIANVVPACIICNYGKNTLSKLEFIAHVKMIYNYQKFKIAQSGHPNIKYTGDPKADHYLTPFGQYNRYKNSAKERGISFKLDYKDFIQYWQKSCNYCGSIINLVGLDRINNDEGYLVSNLNSCCTNCNNLKRVLTLDDFLKHVLKICLHNG